MYGLALGRVSRYDHKNQDFSASGAKSTEEYSSPCPAGSSPPALELELVLILAAKRQFPAKQRPGLD